MAVREGAVEREGEGKLTYFSGSPPFEDEKRT
jgi:hypothetical protein